MNPRQISCPAACPKQKYDERRRDFCDGCEKKNLNDKFRSKVLEYWRERLGIKAASFCFDDVRALLFSVIGMEDKPMSEISSRSGELLSIYLDERNKKEFTENWLREQENQE